MAGFVIPRIVSLIIFLAAGSEISLQFATKWMMMTDRCLFSCFPPKVGRPLSAPGPPRRGIVEGMAKLFSVLGDWYGSNAGPG